MAVIENAYDKKPSKVKEAAKGHIQRKLRKKGIKATAKTMKGAVKLALKPIKWIINIIMSLFGGIIMPVICVMIITVLIVNQFGKIFDVEQYEQECPELVKLFLEERYEEFEAKIKQYVNDEEFISFVCDSEFDNGYTKLVYGGTPAYTQAELKGNYKGVQEQKADWVSYKKNKYYAKSVLETIEGYIDKGVSVDKIKINDEYLKGYKEASGYGSNDSMPFKKWINNSYYVIPFYYHLIS